MANIYNTMFFWRQYMKRDKKYTISLNPRILELLGPNLYTNIYYVLAELIANAYDASARNVYIISKDNEIIVEDDGNGMSYEEINKKYLDIAKETRTSNDDTYTQDELRRRKMGRKGIGKLAALSVSEEVHIKTIKNGDKSGFILSRNIPDSKQLQALEDSDINFDYILNKGTAVVMKNPTYKLNKTTESIKKNLLKIFPLLSQTFKIHIINKGEEVIIDSFDKEMIKELGVAILIGDEFKYLKEFFTNDFNSEKLCKEREVISKDISLIDKFGKKQSYKLEIKGWIGAYKSTRGKKATSRIFRIFQIILYHYLPMVNWENLTFCQILPKINCMMYLLLGNYT